MPDSATLNHAARILATVARDLPADAALRRYLYDARRLGPREKRSVSRAVFGYYRWLRWLDPKVSFQKQLEQAATLQERFTADEKSIKREALIARAVPDWLWDDLSFPAAKSAPAETSPQENYVRQLQREPALWLRARPGTAPHLAHTLGDCAAPDITRLSTLNAQLVPHLDALRYTGAQDLFLTPAFHQGAFEIQDLASQLVGHACAPMPGETWWDTCAGEGGKLLHLADLMANKGVIWATDRNERRLGVLKRRATRAQLFNYRTALWDGGARLPTKTKFDGILVDAPCSGVGTWQRNPHARWTATPDDVRELAITQLALLNHVAGSLKPGGRLVYSVCTLTRRETTAVADAFSAAHPELTPLPLFNSEISASSPSSPSSPSRSEFPAPASQLFLWPHEINANGMFIAAWKNPK